MNETFLQYLKRQVTAYYSHYVKGENLSLCPFRGNPTGLKYGRKTKNALKACK